MRGVLGEAAVKHVAVEFSRDRESARGLSSVVNPVPVKRGSRSAAVKGDALVSDPETVENNNTFYMHGSITKCNINITNSSL